MCGNKLQHGATRALEPQVVLGRDKLQLIIRIIWQLIHLAAREVENFLYTIIC
jgi:hypothetical protein